MDYIANFRAESELLLPLWSKFYELFWIQTIYPKLVHFKSAKGNWVREGFKKKLVEYSTKGLTPPPLAEKICIS